jgi:hypothetical protein
VTDARNTIALVTGRKGTGKSRFLWDWFTSRAPRVLSIDPNGESRKLNPNVTMAIGWDALVDALDRAADYGRWHIAAVLERDDFPKLFRLLTPPRGQGESLAEAFGGMAIECGEAFTVYPNAGTPPELLDALFRARHYGLDFFLATQRPASIAVDVRSMADIVASFSLGSPRDVTAVSAEMMDLPGIADRLQRLPRYHCLYHTRDDGAVYELDPHRRVVGSFNDMRAE